MSEHLAQTNLELSLGRVLLAWARPPFAHNKNSRLGDELNKLSNPLRILAWVRHSFAQNMASRLGEMPKQKHPTLISSCLGEAHSPKRDGLSPKTKIL